MCDLTIRGLHKTVGCKLLTGFSRSNARVAFTNRRSPLELLLSVSRRDTFHRFALRVLKRRSGAKNRERCRPFRRWTLKQSGDEHCNHQQIPAERGLSIGQHQMGMGTVIATFSIGKTEGSNGGGPASRAHHSIFCSLPTETRRNVCRRSHSCSHRVMCSLHMCRTGFQ